MVAVSSRHEGDADGALLPFDERHAVTVRVIVDADIAHLPAAQHTAWMLANLLVRSDGIVTQVFITCPSVDVLPRVIPFGDAPQLNVRLAEAANLIDKPIVTIDDATPAARTIRISGIARTGDDLTVLGAGWWGGLARLGAETRWEGADLDCGVPFGPYLAACFAAAEVFLSARGLPPEGAPVYGWDSFDQTSDVAPSPAPTPDVDLAEAGLAGVGAVGAIWMHSMWAYPGASGTVAIVDADPEGVDETNLNRGVLFVRDDIRRPKAAAAAAHIPDSPIKWDPRFGRFEAAGVRPELLVSAVDKNRARDALQNLYRPRILGASTYNLRAELFHVGAPGVGACLRCFLALEPELTDADVHELAIANPDAVHATAAELDIQAAEAAEWLSSPVCGQIDTDLTERLRGILGEPDVPQFAVGFVSITAGTLLAAETVKVLTGLDDARDESTSVRLQFHDPSRNPPPRLMLRQRACPKCPPDSPATRKWAERRHWFDAGRHM